MRQTPRFGSDRRRAWPRIRDPLVPDPSLTIRDGAIAAWPGAWQGANLRSIVSGPGIDLDKPWRRLREKDRDWLLFTDEQPSVLIMPERDRVDHGYYGKFWSARKHVMHVLADSRSERMRERAMRFVRSVPCPVCHGSGLLRPVAGLERVEESATSHYLFGRAEPLQRCPRTPQGWLHLRGVSRHTTWMTCSSTYPCAC